MGCLYIISYSEGSSLAVYLPRPYILILTSFIGAAKYKLLSFTVVLIMVCLAAKLAAFKAASVAGLLII